MGGSEESTGGHPLTRRQWVFRAAAGAAGSVVFGRAVAALAAEGREITAEMIARAEWIAGLEFTDEERALMLRGLSEAQQAFREMRSVTLANEDAPSLVFRVGAGSDRRPLAWELANPRHRATTGLAAAPSTEEDAAFLPVHEARRLLDSRQISSEELTRTYLSRLERYGPLLECVVTLTPELALEQARRADSELAAGRRRTPLHGIPWGAKDLLAVPGYPTTWGARPYRDQRLGTTAAVAERLDASGAVLVAKLTLGALAWGDVWFGGKTRNPWNPEQGSSGSSAGSAAAAAAGLVGFAIGSETWGSIVSPCTRCGATGLRPTFGRVSRYGAMTLSWSMDKVGPIARSAEDLALVLAEIHGADPRDASSVERPFAWPPPRELRELRVGYTPELFEAGRESDDEIEAKGLDEWREHDLATLELLRSSGATLVPVELPVRIPVGPLSIILTAEAAAVFDDLTRSGRDDLLVRQEEQAWPNVLRQGQLIPAVEYLRANRLRRILQEDVERMLDDVDLYVSPTFSGDVLLMTNLTGHPQVVLPNGFRTTDGTPTSITFTAPLWAESELLAAARAIQRETDFHRRRPPLDDLLAKRLESRG